MQLLLTTPLAVLQGHHHQLPLLAAYPHLPFLQLFHGSLPPELELLRQEPRRLLPALLQQLLWRLPMHLEALCLGFRLLHHRHLLLQG